MKQKKAAEGTHEHGEALNSRNVGGMAAELPPDEQIKHTSSCVIARDAIKNACLKTKGMIKCIKMRICTKYCIIIHDYTV